VTRHRRRDLVAESDGIEPRPSESSGLSRRGLLGGALLIAATGAGITAGALRSEPRAGSGDRSAPSPTSSTPTKPAAPAALSEAADRERRTLADIDAVFAADPAQKADLAWLRADHAAHADAFHAALARYASPTPATQPSSSTPAVSSTPPTRTTLIDTERQTVTNLRAAALTGGNSTTAGSDPGLSAELVALFASVAACDAGHVELLSG
jgi:hypothetical protein